MNEAAKIVAKEGRTLYSFTNEVLEEALKAYRMSITPAEALEFYKVMNIGKKLGYVVVPNNVFDYMTRELHKTSKDELFERWYESGFWIGNYIKMKFQKKDIVDIQTNLMKASLWNVDEISINETDAEVEVKCFSSNLSLSCTETLAKYLHGMFDSLGYSVKSNKVLRGMVSITLQKKQEIKPKVAIEA